MLVAGGVVACQNGNNRTTTNVAYLVNDREVLKQEFQSSKKSMKVSKMASVRIRPTNPSFLMLWRIVRGLCFHVSEREIYPFFLKSTFPLPEEDFLLYSVLAGSAEQPGLFLSNCVRASVADIVSRWTSQIIPSFTNHETIVFAAVFTACNAGSMSGCSLEELIARFVAELSVPHDKIYPDLTPVDKIKWNGKFKSKFLLPFDTTLPPQVLEVLGITQCCRTPKSDSADAISSVQCDDILVEAVTTTDAQYVKDRIQIARERQDPSSRITFIVIEGIKKEDIIPNRAQIAKYPRNESKSRVFLVDVDESNKVVLKPLDGAPLHMKADRLIFVVCLGDLSRKFMRE